MITLLKNKNKILIFLSSKLYVLGLLSERSPPAIPHIKLKEVVVDNSVENSFLITMKSHDCGYNFPLLGEY